MQQFDILIDEPNDFKDLHHRHQKKILKDKQFPGLEQMMKNKRHCKDNNREHKRTS